MLVALPLAAGAAYLLCRELTGQFGPSLIGGLLFGLSPYMLGHVLSQHLDLAFVAPIPLLALLIVRNVRGRTSSRRFVAMFATLLLVLLGTSFELFLDTAFLTALAFGLALLHPRGRRLVPRTGSHVALAYGVCLPVLAPLAVLALSASHGPLQYAPSDYSIDLLNVVVPTTTLLAGTPHFARAATQNFVGNIGEKDGYLGIPLLLVALLAVRAEWRRSAWLAGSLTLCALILSLGPMLTVDGRPVIGLPFALAGLPLLGNALPARLSLFTALGAASLCALWVARPQRAALRMVVGVALVLSMLPNFAPPTRLAGAWARSDAFGWSTNRAPLGFVGERTWPQLVGAPSSVLVLPTGAGTAAEYWQASTGMRFALAIPATPFVPRAVRAAPIVRGLVEDVPPALAAPRLRAFLISDRIGAVFVARFARSRWRKIAAKATAARPTSVNGGTLYRVPRTLTALAGAGDFVVATSTSTVSTLGSKHTGIARALAWLRFDGRRADLCVRLQSRGHTVPAVTLSSPDGDADMPALSADHRGDVAVVFTEWRHGVNSLKIATFVNGSWRVATLDRRSQPIWSPRVLVTPSGEMIATWIDEDPPLRTVRVSARPPGGSWRRPLTLERADGLGSVAVRAAAADRVVMAWRDQIASERRIRAVTYTSGRWSPAITLASGLSTLDDLTLSGRNPTYVRWNLEGPTEQRPKHFAARLRGSIWTGFRQKGLN